MLVPRSLLLFLLALAPLALAPASQAQAKLPPLPHCVLLVDPVRPGETESVVREERCFATFREAVAHATDGRVQLDPTIGPTEVTEAMLNGANSQGETIYSIDYMWPNYEPDPIFGTKTYRSSSGGCTPTQSYAIGGFIDIWWNDSISSSRAFAGCDVNKLYPDALWRGKGKTCRPDCPTLGEMDNKTSSRMWCHTDTPCPAPGSEGPTPTSVPTLTPVPPTATLTTVPTLTPAPPTATLTTVPTLTPAPPTATLTTVPTLTPAPPTATLAPSRTPLPAYPYALFLPLIRR